MADYHWKIYPAFGEQDYISLLKDEVVAWCNESLTHGSWKVFTDFDEHSLPYISLYVREKFQEDATACRLRWE